MELDEEEYVKRGKRRERKGKWKRERKEKFRKKRRMETRVKRQE